MLRPLAKLICVCLILVQCLISGGAELGPTKEVNLTSVGLEVKQHPSKEDVEQFFKDQEHLLPNKANQTAGTNNNNNNNQQQQQLLGLVGGFGQSLAVIQQIPVNISNLMGAWSNLGLPTALNPADFGSFLVTGPLDVVAELLGSRLIGYSNNSDNGKQVPRFQACDCKHETN